MHTRRGKSESDSNRGVATRVVGVVVTLRVPLEGHRMIGEEKQITRDEVKESAVAQITRRELHR